jgi:hypothetical protein
MSSAGCRRSWVTIRRRSKLRKETILILPKIAKKQKAKPQTCEEPSAVVRRVFHRAAKVARNTVLMHGTPICIWKDRKVAAEKP